MKGAALVSSTGQAALNHPFIGSDYADLPGLPIGINVRTRQLVCIDFWLLKRLGNIHSTFVQIFGPKDCGKSALMKWIVLLGCMRVAEYDRMRVVIHDRKPEGKDSEYGPLSRKAGCTPFVMGEMQANPFEKRLHVRRGDQEMVYELGVIEMAKLLAEYDDGVQLTPMEYYVMRIAVYVMISQYREEGWSIASLTRIVAGLQPEMLTSYHSQLDQKLVAEAKLRSANVVDLTVRQAMLDEVTALAYTPRLVSFDDLLGPAKQLAAKLDNLTQGEMGSIIGAKHSLYDLNTQRAVAKVWLAMSPKAETLARLIDTKVSLLAAELNRDDMQPHIEVDDERHRSMENLTYAKTLSYKSEIARANPTLNLGSSHRHESLRKGGVGSDLWNYGDLVIRNSGLRIYGRLDNNSALMAEVRDMNHMTEAEVRQLTMLPNWYFGAKLHGQRQPMTVFRTVIPSLALETVMESNAAANSMAEPTRIGSPKWVQRYAKRNGIQMVNPEGSET